MSLHEKYIQRCLDMAKKGFGKTAPNPMVGCVIVYNGKIIGEGFHEKYGKAHAEVNAINSVKNKKHLKDSTLYVNLEPCSHFGKTPPCADLIIRMGIKYVVIGTIDPNPQVMGKGLQKLVAAGCDVKVGILESECRELNKRFFTFYEKRRPYVILKWAETSDHYMGVKFSSLRSSLKGKDRVQISGPTAQKMVHHWRAEEQAIMVGTNTALMDNPKLTVRKAKGRNPVRVLIDRKLKVPSSFHLLDGSVQTLVFTEQKRTSEKNLEYVSIDFRKNVLSRVLTELHKRNLQSLIVEGGAKLLGSLMGAGLWDEARFFISPRSFRQIAGRKVRAVKAPDMEGRVLVNEMIGRDQFLKIQ